MRRQRTDAHGQTVLFEGLREETPMCPAQFERDEFQKLLQRLSELQTEAGLPAGAVSWFSFREMLSACRSAGAFSWMLPVGDSPREHGRAASKFGLVFKRYYGIPLRITRLVAMGLFAPRPSPVLTLSEAVVFVKKGGIDAFYRWDRKFGPCSCGHGRYSRARLERGLEREARR